jgi:GDP-4-dehydro-6-deoxy-D-mannose reductase
MTLLLTGAAGFVARHFVEHARGASPGLEILGVVRPHGGAAATVAGGVRTVEADLCDPAAVDAIFAQFSPTAILHLAGQSSVHQSWLDPGGTLRNNVLGIVNLLDAVRRRGLAPAVLVVGSAEEYGAVDPGEVPLTETALLRPTSPYAVSKVAQGLVAVECGGAAGMRVVRTRTFHHTGPGRGEAFAESSFARQIAEIEAGLRPPVLQVGNLEAVRDFTDVRDVVKAYWALLEKGAPGQVYNVCSGRGRRIRELLDTLLSLCRVDVEIAVDPARLRPSDLPVLVGDPSRLKAATGWEPSIDLKDTLAELLDDWRARIAAIAAAPRP